MSASGVEQMAARAEGWVTEGVHPALVVLAARRGIVFLHEAYGNLTPAADSPSLPREALFPLASLTKPITATVAMTLVEEGHLGLNRRVQEYIPEWVGEKKDQVMVHHLLTHSAGLPDDETAFSIIFERDEAGVETSPGEDSANPTIHRWLHLGLDIPLESEPGTEMQYSSYGIQLLAEIIRRLTGMSLEGLASAKLFGPLGMNDTYYSVPRELWERIVVRPDDSADAENFNSTESYERPSPSGGAYSTAMDMVIFGQMLLNRGVYDGIRVLSPVTVAAMTRNQLPGIGARFLEESFPEAALGLGWSVNSEYKGLVYGETMVSKATYLHGGWGGVLLWMDPEHEIVGVYFSVAMGHSDTESHLVNADLFMNMVAAAVEAEPS